MAKQPFPSARQARGLGVRPALYPAYLRDRVDYDYIDRLSAEERTWLAAFTEEWLKGWSLKSETQVLPIEARREVWAARRRAQRAGQHEAQLHHANMVHEALREQPPSASEVEDQIIRAIDHRRMDGRPQRRGAARAGHTADGGAAEGESEERP